MGNFAKPVDDFDLINRVNRRRKTAVHTEDFLVDDGGHGQAVEAISEGFPKFDVVPPLA